MAPSIIMDKNSSSSSSTSAPSVAAIPVQHQQHGVKGVYYGGEWLDMEDCGGGRFLVAEDSCSGCDFQESCPRSRSRNTSAIYSNNNNNSKEKDDDDDTGRYDVLIVGAGCLGAAIARELSRYRVSVLLVEAADDVAQGATKGNSGIVHAGYDDTPGTNRAKYCWRGNQMFGHLDRELRFGYQRNGSLVLALKPEDRQELLVLKERGETNGVKNLRIVEREELRQMEPHVHPDAMAALYSPDAGNVIPYEVRCAILIPSWQPNSIFSSFYFLRELTLPQCLFLT
jgi:glycerol-3-phosphate dehydrogenase